MKKIFAYLIVLGAAFSEEKYVVGDLPREGFFSMFLGALVNVMWADKNGITPVVHWSEKCFYAQEEGYNGNSNPWEYYFEPVSHLSYENGDTIHQHFFDPNNLSLYMIFVQNRNRFNTLRFEAKEAIDKYIRIRPYILEKACTFYEQKMKGKITIGIHLRGTDKVRGYKMEIMQHLLDAAEKAARMVGEGDVQFFVGTDEEALLSFAKQGLKRPVIHCDSFRSKGNDPIHIPNPKVEYPKALLGEEVLIEGLLFSECDFLVHTLSCVALTALLFNPNLPYEFVSLDVFKPLPNINRLPKHYRRQRHKEWLHHCQYPRVPDGNSVYSDSD